MQGWPHRGWLIRWLVTAAIAAHAAPASAQEAECFPPCRSGFLCHEGACVSACNPPCPAGQACQGGECVLAASTAQQAPAQPVAPVQATPAQQAPAQQAPAQQAPAQQAPAQQAPTEPQPIAASIAAPSDHSGGGWVTVPSGGSAPQPPGDDRREELRQIRKQFHLAAYLTPGLVYMGAPRGGELRFVTGELEASGESWSGSYSGEMFALAIGLGVGVRGNFAYLVGFQARAYFDLFPALSGYLLVDDFGLTCEGEARQCEATGIGVRFGADVSFRIGPFAQAFPMYIGLGGFAGGRQLTASSDLSDYARFVPEVGTLAELGFIFGGNENMDLGARVEFGPKLGDSEAFFVGAYLSFGIALASTGP